MRATALLLAAALSWLPAGAACEGRWVNPVSDICWSCIFPDNLRILPAG